MYIVTDVIDLSKIDIYGNPIEQTTANCYVIKEAGKYKFPLVFGNAIKDGQVNSIAYTNNGGSNARNYVDYMGKIINSPYIELVSGTVNSAQLSITDTDKVFTNIEIINGNKCRYLQLEINSIPGTGANGIISIKDNSNVIMWSWHIWIWPYDLTTVEITNHTNYKYKILPVNLATKLDSASSINQTTGWKNWAYQWGRPTPLLCSSTYTSTSNHTSYGVLSFSKKDQANYFYLGIQNPSTFYYQGGSGYENWFKDSSNNVCNLWNADLKTYSKYGDNINVIKTIYDPCPIGFKVPNASTFSGFTTTGKDEMTLEKLNVIGEYSNGYKFKKNSEDITGVFFPEVKTQSYASGDFSTATGTYYWTSHSVTYYSGCLLFYSSRVAPSFQYRRPGGLAIRPIQDIAPIEPSYKITTIRIDQTKTDPSSMITRIKDFGGIEAVRENSHRYIGSYDSENQKMQLKQLNDIDGTRFADGSDASNYLSGYYEISTFASGDRPIFCDVWMKLPQFWYKCTQYALDIWDFTIAFGNRPDSTYTEWDGKDLIGVYEAYFNDKGDGALYSISNVDSGSYISYTTSKTSVQKRGEGFSLIKWKHHCIMAMLFYTQYTHTNSQGKIGSGTNSYNKTTGQTNSLGMIDTDYYDNGNSNSINFWGLENWWGNKFEWIDNIEVVFGNWKITEDNGTIRTASGGSISNFTKSMLFGNNIDLIPIGTGGSSTTGFCDYYYTSTSGSSTVLRSGSGNSLSGGISNIEIYVPETNGNSIGTRIAFRGEYEILDY